MISYHPRNNDHGLPVELCKPTAATALSCWHESSGVASVVPDGPMPGRLNGIDIKSWSPSASEGAALAGKEDPREPRFSPPPGMAAAAGAIVVEDDGRIWLVAPSNQFGGYAATFPKGRVDHGGDLRSTAVREVFEESGLKVKIEGFLIDTLRTQTFTRYYIGRRIGGTPADMGWESQAVLLAPLTQLRQFAASQHDLPVITALEAWHAMYCDGYGALSVQALPHPVTVPFYSARTLAEDHLLVAELPGGATVYKHVDGKFATIGTRGHRPSDGSAGLIVHDAVSAKHADQAWWWQPRGFKYGNPSHWRGTKSPMATLLNVLDQHGVVLLG